MEGLRPIISMPSAVILVCVSFLLLSLSAFALRSLHFAEAARWCLLALQAAAPAEPVQQQPWIYTSNSSSSSSLLSAEDLALYAALALLAASPDALRAEGVGLLSPLSLFGFCCSICLQAFTSCCLLTVAASPCCCLLSPRRCCLSLRLFLHVSHVSSRGYRGAAGSYLLAAVSSAAL